MKVLSAFGRSRDHAVRRPDLAIAAAVGLFFQRARCSSKGSIFGQALDRSRGNGALVVFAVVLCMALVIEVSIMNAAARTNNLDNASMRLRTFGDAQATHAAFPVEVAVNRWATAAAARPLFSPGRSPVQAIAQAPTLPEALPRLAGIVITSNERIGIFCGPDGNSTIVKAGNRLGVFEVVSIAADSVQISGPAGMKRFQISFDANPIGRMIANAATVKSGALLSPGSNAWPSQFKVTQQ